MKNIYFLLNGALFMSLLFLNSCSDPSFTKDNLGPFFQDHMKEFNIPGLAAGIVKDKSLDWSNGYGFSNLKDHSPMTINTIINVGSVSKTVTTTAILQLWERDSLSLEDDINAYLPDSLSIRNPKHPNAPITFRHLLTHTSSIEDGSSYDFTYQCGDPALSLEDWIIQYFTPEGSYYDPDQNFSSETPGASKSYSNVGFGLLGYLVERISGLSFPAYCQTHIFEPLEMNNTGWLIEAIDRNLHATPYFYVTTENVDMLRSRGEKTGLLSIPESPTLPYQSPVCLYNFPNFPDGALRSSIDDLSHFLVPFLNEGTYKSYQLLKPNTIQEMLSLQVEGDQRQGLGWWYTGIDQIWGHDGQDPGVMAGLFFNSEKKVGMIFLQNSSEGKVRRLIERLYRTALSE